MVAAQKSLQESTAQSGLVTKEEQT